jgi:hypothetical protein
MRKEKKYLQPKRHLSGRSFFLLSLSSSPPRPGGSCRSAPAAPRCHPASSRSRRWRLGVLSWCVPRHWLSPLPSCRSLFCSSLWLCPLPPPSSRCRPPPCCRCARPFPRRPWHPAVVCHRFPSSHSDPRLLVVPCHLLVGVISRRRFPHPCRAFPRLSSSCYPPCEEWLTGGAGCPGVDKTFIT